MTAPPGEAWQWVVASHALALGSGEHTLRLQFDRPGVELKQVRVTTEPLGGGGTQAEDVLSPQTE